MSTSMREAILSRLATTTLKFTSVGPPVPATYRSRKTGVTKAESPVIIVAPVNEPVERIAQAGDRRDLEVEVQLVVRGDPWDSIADPWAVSIHGAIFSDATLLAMVSNVRATDTLWTDEEADRTAGVLSMRFRFTYLASANSIAAPAFP